VPQARHKVIIITSPLCSKDRISLAHRATAV